MRSFRRRRRGGFTLIELMAVIIIVGILAAVAVPMYLRYTARAKMSEALAGLGAIRSAERVYFAEHEAYLAVAAGDVGSDPSDTPPGLGLDFTDNTYFDEEAYSVVLDATYGFVATATGSASTGPRASDISSYAAQRRGDGTTRVDYGDGPTDWE